jgi:hypothetical protein
VVAAPSVGAHHRPVRIVPEGGLPADAFAVVMATGIVSVAARYTGSSAVATVLAAAAAGALAVLTLCAAVGLATTGVAVAAGPDPLARSLQLFSAAAACDVLAAALGPEHIAVTATLGAVAAVVWSALVWRVLVAWRSRPARTRSDGARGGWLLAAVATESLALTAAHLTRAGMAVRVLFGVAIAWWALGLAAYLVIAVPVVRRIVAARADVEVLTPDVWVLMGGLAIATLAGSSIDLASRASDVFAWTAQVVGPTALGLWALATIWLPGLVAVEVRRARRVPVRYEGARWATVFPLGMYSAATSVLAMVLAGSGTVLPALLRGVADAAYVVALLVWGVVASGLARRGWRRVTTARG